MFSMTIPFEFPVAIEANGVLLAKQRSPNVICFEVVKFGNDSVLTALLSNALFPTLMTFDLRDTFVIEFP